MYLLIALLAAVATDPIPIAGERQFFIDTLFIQDSHNVTLCVRPANKTCERSLQPDKPWESASLNWFSILDDAGKYRMWYEAYDIEGWPTSDDTSFCYAESADGILWTKPSLDLIPYRDIPHTNILFRTIGPAGANSRVHGAGVFIDPKAPPTERYKAVSQGAFSNLGDPPYFVAGMTSPDGLHWTRYPTPICRVFADSQYSAFWDDLSAKYILFGRVSGRGRSVGRSASAAFTSFDPLQLVLQTPEAVPQSDVYNPAAIKYADHVCFMFPSIYRHDTDTLDIGLAVSRDSINWTWPQFDIPFIPLSADDLFDSGSLYMGQGLIRKENETWLYYSGSPLKHNQAELPNLTKPGNQRIYTRATVPLDRFVGVFATREGGQFTTPPLLYKGERLVLNFESGEGEPGAVRVAILNQENRPIPNRSLNDCIRLTGDQLNATVTWKDGPDVSPHQSTPVRLLFQLHNVSLYTFQFKRANAG